MIEKYLQPIAIGSKAQEEIKAGLTDLRNKMAALFFMVNIIFIIAILVLQMQKDCLHIEWPLGPKFNHSVVVCNSDKREHVWMVTRLQLEPIGLLFLVFYMSILAIQVNNSNIRREGDTIPVVLVHCHASTQVRYTRTHHSFYGVILY